MSEKKTSDKSSNNNDLKPLYARSIVNSLSSGTVSPFLGVYAVKLGASASEMGWFQSVANLTPNMMQIPWGKLSDNIGKRVPFIILGGLITAVLWVPLMFVTSAAQVILVIAVQSLLGSMAVPTWTALIGDIAHSFQRGMTTAAINRWTAIGSLLATLVAGYLMVIVTGSLQQMFLIPIVLAVIFGVASSLVMFRVKEKPHANNVPHGSIFSVRDIMLAVRSNPNFMRFTLASVVFGFFMSVSWPLFSITTISVLNANMLEVALIGVLSTAVTIAFQSWGGRLVDVVGRRPLIIVYRLSFVLVPVFYAVATNVYYLYLLNLIIGVLAAFGDIALFAYLLDITQEGLRGTLTAFYNLVTGIVYFIGSLLGGYLAVYLVGIYGLVFGLQIVYAVSAVGRGAGALSFLTIKEPHKYPSTLRRKLREIMHKLPLITERGRLHP